MSEWKMPDGCGLSPWHLDINGHGQMRLCNAKGFTVVANTSNANIKFILEAVTFYATERDALEARVEELEATVERLRNVAGNYLDCVTDKLDINSLPIFEDELKAALNAGGDDD